MFRNEPPFFLIILRKSSFLDVNYTFFGAIFQARMGHFGFLNRRNNNLHRILTLNLCNIFLIILNLNFLIPLSNFRIANSTKMFFGKSAVLRIYNGVQRRCQRIFLLNLVFSKNEILMFNKNAISISRHCRAFNV